MSPQEPGLRQTYLLRIWEERTSLQDGRSLRFILQEVRTGQREGFGSLEALIAFLRAQLDLGDGERGVRPASPAEQDAADHQDLPHK